MASLMPTGKQQYFNPTSGRPLAGGLLYTYAAGTSTPKTTWQDAAGTTPNTNPITLDSTGSALIYWDGAYKVVLKDSAGSTIWTVDNYNSDPFGIAAYIASVASSIGSSLIGFIQAGVGAVARTVQDELRDVVKVTQYGADIGASTAANKLALQKAITAVDAAGGGVIVVPGGINYGYVRTDLSTHPDFTDCTSSITVLDYGIGSSYAAPAKDGAQIRQFFFTPDPSNSDANVIYHRGAWHPALLLSNDANLAEPGDPSRTELDNRRVSVFFDIDGSSAARLGLGDRAGSDLTDEELSNIVIESYALPGDTLGNWAPLIIERKTGNMAFGQGNTTPQAGYYFKPMTVGYPVMILEGLDTTASFVMRNSNGSDDDIRIQNRSGDFVFNIPAVGDAVFIKKTTRYVGIGASGDFMLDVADSRNGSFASKINNLDATRGQILYLASGSATSSSWDALLAEAVGANAIFRLRGDGNGLCDGSWTGGGADRAEMFEWADGNPSGIDGEKKQVGSNRAGYSVVLVDGKIRIAQAGETPIGVVSLTYDSLGNAAPLNWTGKFLNDDLGAPIMEDCEIVEWEERILLDPAKEATPPVDRTMIRGGKPYIFTDPGTPAQVAKYDVKKHSHYADQIPEGLSVPADATRTQATRRKITLRQCDIEGRVRRFDPRDVGVLLTDRRRCHEQHGSNRTGGAEMA